MNRLAKHVLAQHPEKAGGRAVAVRSLRESQRKQSLSRAKAAAAAGRRADRMSAVKTVVAIAAVAGLMGVIYYVVNLPPVPQGGGAPDFAVVDTDGGRFALSDQNGKPVLVYLMRGTWCLVCKSSMPALREVWSDYRSKGLVLITIDLDTSESDSQIAAYKTDVGATWRFARDTDHVGAKYNAQQPGAKFFIDRSGNVVSTSYGVASYDDMRPILDKLVA